MHIVIAALVIAESDHVQAACIFSYYVYSNQLEGLLQHFLGVIFGFMP